MTDYSQISLQQHEKYRGKREIQSKVPLKTTEDLSTFYSPGVAAPCLEIAKNPQAAEKYTAKKNTIAVISDGSAVLGLGNIGAQAALPVMEGKAILFKEFGGVNAVPLVIDTQDPEEIITFVKQVAPSFGGINLEDIAAPKCFYIEKELQKNLNIPVMHDDQHGTAIVVLAGILNALKIKQKILASQKIVISGAGAAALAIGKLLHTAGAQEILFIDSKGILSSHRDDLNPYKQEVLPYNLHQLEGTLQDALLDADIFIGVSKGNLLHGVDIQKMHDDPIIFALANPIPEIFPEEALENGAFIVATGRSDYPNQINNLLAFPGVFKGLLSSGITQITEQHYLRAAQALASCIEYPTKEKILPSVFETKVVEKIAQSFQSDL